MKKIISLMGLSLFLSSLAFGKEFEVFDGRLYNGLYYPLVDIIEWQEKTEFHPHMEFHIHSRDAIEVSVESGTKNGRPVLWIMYDLRFRNEKICRHVLAPVHFREGTKIFAYKDNSDPDYVNFYFSSDPMRGLKDYVMPPYERCNDENASNKPDGASRNTASVPSSSGIIQPRMSGTPAATQPSSPKAGKGVGVDYENQAVPFSF